MGQAESSKLESRNTTLGMCKTGNMSDKDCSYVDMFISSNGGPNCVKLLGVWSKIFVESFKGK